MPKGTPYSAEFKKKIVLEVLREDNTISEIAVKHRLHPNRISTWKVQFLKSCEQVFRNSSAEERLKELEKSQNKREEDFLKQIGSLTVELNWAKKNLKTLDLEIKMDLIERGSKDLSLRKQCQILGLCRQNLYYQARVKVEDQILMNKIDEIFTKHPAYGYRNLWQNLLSEGFQVGRDKVLRLMRVMGIKAVFPGKRTTVKNFQHKIYPYLLRNVKITECNQVWSTDITYIQMARGFCYLTAVIDWHSRMILSHRVSNSMSVDFCIESLEEALSKYPKPEIFNTDQGSQFTSKEFTEILLEKGVRISMDGRGRATDNAIIERFWRSIKYEDIFLKKYESIKEVKDGVKQYIDFYNQERLHSAIEYQTPRNLYFKDISSNLIKF